MVHQHPSTADQRVQAASQMLAQQGVYGMVTHLSQALAVSRQTLYPWKNLAHDALMQAFMDSTPTSTVDPHLERQIVTLAIEGHNSIADIQRCLAALLQRTVSVGTISGLIQEAQRRALHWMATHAPTSHRSVALDEIYGNNRRGAYLNIVDTHSWAVWAAHGPLPVDTDSWTLVLWELQERGLTWFATSSDGGKAIHAACQAVDPGGQHGRDVWHVCDSCAKVQARLERHVTQLEQQTSVVARQAARMAAGKPARGARPKTDLTAHQAALVQARTSVADVRYLTTELHDLLEVVVLDQRGVLTQPEREAELLAMLSLLAEVGDQALPAGKAEIMRLHKQIAAALSGLLAFVPTLERVEQEVVGVLGREGLALVAWAWQRRAILGPSTAALVAGLPEAWRTAARMLMQSWERAVRSSSAVENWHSIIRPHMAVHRGVSGGMLALLAVWHKSNLHP